MDEIQYTCKCSHEGEDSPQFNWKRTTEEVVEFLHAPSMCELSDVILNFSCFLHALFSWWKWVLPGGGRSQRKGMSRYRLHGCCRSQAHSCFPEYAMSRVLLGEMTMAEASYMLHWARIDALDVWSWKRMGGDYDGEYDPGMEMLRIAMRDTYNGSAQQRAWKAWVEKGQ